MKIIANKIFITLIALISLWLSNGIHAEQYNLEKPVTYVISVFGDHENLLEDDSTYAISWQLFNLSAQDQNLVFEIIPSDWNSSINRLKNGKMDLVFGAFKTLERESWALFSLPLMPEKTSMHALQDHPVESLKDIDNYENYSVAVIAQSTQQTLAESLGFKKIYAARERDNLRVLLYSQRVDFIITQGSYPFSCPQPNCVKQFEPLALHYFRVMGMDKPETLGLIKSVNAGLQNIINSEKASEILNTYSASSSIDTWKSQMQKEVTQSVK